jgi:hypothetical protein
MTTYHYSDERRNDPELREKTAKVIEARKAALAVAAKKLREAMDILDPLRIFDGDPIFERSAFSAWRAYNQVSGDASFMNRPTTDTYIGNLAASELGEQIEAMGDNFYNYFPKKELND